MSLTRSARAAAGLILVLLAGCDNVSWGGADVAIIHPPPRAEPPAEGTEEAGIEPLPQSPLLYYVVRTTAGSHLIPVGEIVGDSLAPIRAAGDPETFAGRFIAEFMREGAEFTLFTRGRRAGTFIVDNAELPTVPACPLLPSATGTLELSSDITATEFLALARADAPAIRARAAPPALPSRLSIVAPILAERMIRARGAELPGNWQAAMEQLAVLPLDASPNPGFTATFLVGDTLGPGMDEQGYSLFFIGVPTANQTGYDSVYVSFRQYAETGKAAPRVVDYLDWSRDESPEILLHVYGVADAWFEAVARQPDGSWRRVFRDKCEDGGRTIQAPQAQRDTLSAPRD